MILIRSTPHQRAIVLAVWRSFAGRPPLQQPGQTRRRAWGKGFFCQHQVDHAQGHDLSNALQVAEDLVEVADRVWNCLNLVPGAPPLPLPVGSLPGQLRVHFLLAEAHSRHDRADPPGRPPFAPRPLITHVANKDATQEGFQRFFGIAFGSQRTPLGITWWVERAPSLHLPPSTLPKKYPFGPFRVISKRCAPWGSASPPPLQRAKFNIQFDIVGRQYSVRRRGKPQGQHDADRHRPSAGQFQALE